MAIELDKKINEKGVTGTENDIVRILGNNNPGGISSLASLQSSPMFQTMGPGAVTHTTGMPVREGPAQNTPAGNTGTQTTTTTTSGQQTSELPADALIQMLTRQTQTPSLPGGAEFDPTQQQLSSEEMMQGVQLGSVPTVDVNSVMVSGPDGIEVPLVEAVKIGHLTPEVTAALGQVSPESLVQAAQMAGIPDIEIPQILSRANIPAAQIEELPEIQTIRGQLSQAAQATAATATESPEMKAALEEERDRLINFPVDPRATVQEQYTRLMSDVGSGTPPWAAAAVRAAEQKLAARGLGASSMAAEGITAALMQAALPIAAQDAQVFQTMNMEKLSQTAALGALRASHIAQLDITNLQNQQQANIQNANAALQIDITNLNNEQQVAIQNAQNALARATSNAGFAQQAAIEEARQNLQIDTSNMDATLAARIENARNSLTVETTNMTARQQANIQNAQAFLSMDMSNLDRQQQAAIVNSQARLQTLMSDQAAINVARNLNTQNTLETSKFMTELGQRAKEFNASQSLSAQQFNSNMQFQRQKFNAENALLVQQSNIDYLRRINTANTALENQANLVNSQNLLGISNAAMANLVTLARDREAFNFQSSENAEERAVRRSIAELQANTNLRLQSNEQKARNSSFLGSLASDVIGGIVDDIDFGGIFGGGGGGDSGGSSGVDLGSGFFDDTGEEAFPG